MMPGAEAVLSVVSALDAHGIPYMLSGSLSSNRYGRARSTRDADFVIQLGAANIGRVFDALRPSVVFDPQLRMETVTFTLRWVGEVSGTEFKIELFQVQESDPHDVARFSRRSPKQFFDTMVMFPSAEDVVVQKLRWWARQKRAKDITDLIAVLEVQLGKLDLDYIRHWADQHGTRAIFEELLEDANRAGHTS